MSLGTRLKKAGAKLPEKRKEPLWKGPEEDGITQSLLSLFLVCRERFRLKVVEGWTVSDTFNHRLHYGEMWHVCEEAFAADKQEFYDAFSRSFWLINLIGYCQALCKKYRSQQEQIEHWYQVCKAQFPIYVDFWSKHPDVKDRKPLLQEQVFNVPYKLPSGRIVRLRGKWDAVDLIGKGKSAGIYLQENKTKGDIVEQQLKRQLTFDLQTMFYLVALQKEKTANKTWTTEGPEWKNLIKGVRYNVIRRPLSGGKDSIKQHQPSKANPQGESKEAFYNRLQGLIADHPEYYFMRWKVEVSQQDIERFKREFLDPILEQLCRWWDWVSKSSELFDAEVAVHWRTPYGFYSPLAEGGSTELDEYLATGSTVGLEQAKTLFGELE